MVSQVGATEEGARRRARNRRGEGTRLRDELVTAARQLLMTAERESDLSIRAVARAAGVAPQSFYLQFSSLDELLYAVYALEFGDLREAMAGAMSGVADPAGRLLALCRGYCAYAEAHPGRYRLLTGVPGQLHEAWEGHQMPGAPAFELLLQTVAAALADRDVGTDPYLAASSLWAWLHGIVTLRAARPAFRWPPLEDMLVSVVQQLLAAQLSS
jgi:AcrR family transcriptional regulator